MDEILNEVRRYQEMLAQFGGQKFKVEHSYFGNRLPYCWKITTASEPVEYVATIEIAPKDILRMNGKGQSDQTEYLRARFGHLFVISQSKR